MALSVSDLLAGAPRLRTKAVNYGPGLDFELHSFTADVYDREIAKLADAEPGESQDEIEDEAVIRLAMKLIDGEGFDASDEQVRAFSEKLDFGVIRAIVSDGLEFNRGAESMAEAAKKS